MKQTNISFEEVMQTLEALATPQTRKVYLSHGVHDPYWGVPTTAMRPLSKLIKRNQPLAEQLYATGNYDAMYFAGMIADPKVMTEADFDRWMRTAYFYMLADYVVSVSLSETPFAQSVSDRWMQSGDDLRMSAAWSCYQWLLGNRADEEFDTEKIRTLLHTVEQTIHKSPNRTRHSMNGFVIAVGSSFIPLHEEALSLAERLGRIKATTGKGACAIPLAAEAIRKVKAAGRVGFKRRTVRC